MARRRFISLAVATILAAGSIVGMSTESEAAVPTLVHGFAIYTSAGQLRALYRDEPTASEILSGLVSEDPRWYPDLIPMDFDDYGPGTLRSDEPGFTPTIE